MPTSIAIVMADGKIMFFLIFVCVCMFTCVCTGVCTRFVCVHIKARSADRYLGVKQ